MYLTAKKFFWTEDYDKGTQSKEAETIKALFSEMKDSKLDYVIFQIGYWRKANAIHNWFVENVQNGDDNCDDYYVDTDKLKELKEICEKIISVAKLEKGKISAGWTITKGERVNNYVDGMVVTNVDELKEILPTTTYTSGFFFGSIDYDEYYIQDIKDTIEIIDKALALDSSWEIYYTSSW